jgi:hypothetical protein
MERGFFGRDGVSSEGTRLARKNRGFWFSERGPLGKIVVSGSMNAVRSEKSWFLVQ